MSDLNCRLWLNWEAFEVAAINSLFTANITLEQIGQFVSKFTDLTSTISFDEWKEKTTAVFKLNGNQQQALYSTLVCFITRDPEEALVQAQIYRTNQKCLPSQTIRVTDFLVYLFVLFVKKKFRGVAELSNFEAFPGKKETERLSPYSKPLSASTPSVSARLEIPAAHEQSQYSLMQRFFLNRLLPFLRIFAKDGLTRTHVESLSFVIIGGPNYAYRANNLITALNLFHGTEIEDIARFNHAVATLLPLPKELEAFATRAQAPTSPITYRPLFPRALMDSTPSENPLISLDKPRLITYMNDQYLLETPTIKNDVHIHNCKQMHIYICGVVSTLFISHCKESTIFVGAATAIHLEYCANVRVIGACRMVHFDSCTRCVGYLLVNTRPIVTGNCTRLTLAPYNALYQKFGMDTLCIGINPLLNLWNQPIVLGSFGVSSVWEKLSPPLFRLFVVPFMWEYHNPVVNVLIPDEYQQALEARKTRIMNLKNDLDMIRSKDPELHAKLVDQMKSASSKWIEKEGFMNDVKWLYEFDGCE